MNFDLTIDLGTILTIGTTIFTFVTLINQIKTSTDANTQAINKLEAEVVGLKKDIAGISNRLTALEVGFQYLKDFVRPKDVLTMEKVREELNKYVLKKD